MEATDGRLLVGLTGGLAAGKSTVARLLGEQGFTVVDADDIVADLYRPGEPGAHAIRRLLGEEALTAEGGVDHRKVAARIFAEPSLRQAVEEAVHPLVRKRFAELAAGSEGVVVLEATLLVEAGYPPDFDLVISVEADSEIRLARAVARGLGENAARARLAAQGDGLARRAAADRILINDGTLDELRAEVGALADELRARLTDPTGGAMDRSAPTDHPVHRLIAARHSPRAFAEKEVEDGTLRSLLEAARWSASSYNEQPWAWIVGRRGQGDAWDRVLGCLVAFNQAWAQGAPVLMLAVARETFARNGKPNPHADYDLGQATAQMVIEATARDLVAHQMAGFDADAARRAFGIPEGHHAVAAIALGHPGDPASLPDGLRDREGAPRQRKALADMVFSDRFGDPSPFLDDGS